MVCFILKLDSHLWEFASHLRNMSVNIYHGAENRTLSYTSTAKFATTLAPHNRPMGLMHRNGRRVTMISRDSNERQAKSLDGVRVSLVFVSLVTKHDALRRRKRRQQVV